MNDTEEHPTDMVEASAPAPPTPTPAEQQLSLALPGLEVTAVGIDTVGIGRDAALDALRLVVPVGRAWRWTSGDLVLACCGHDLARQHEAWQAIAGLDIEHVPTLMRSVLVAAAFPLERRRASLSWSHHEAVHGLDPAEADEWLRLAEAHRWSCHTLNERLKASRESHRQDELPGVTPPRPWAKEHGPTLAALDKVFKADPTAVVLVTADGTWTKVPGDDPRVRAAIEATGAET